MREEALPDGRLYGKKSDRVDDRRVIHVGIDELDVELH